MDEKVVDFNLTFSNDEGDEISIIIKDKKLILNREGVQNKSLPDSFLVTYATEPVKEKAINNLDVFFDVNIIEIIVNHGSKSITAIIAPNKQFTRIKATGNRKEILFRDLNVEDE